MVIQTKLCGKHLQDSISILTQYNNWCLTPIQEGSKEGGRKGEGRDGCSFDCTQEAAYQVRKVRGEAW